VSDLETSVESGPARLPIRLTMGCVRVLPVTGAGLSLFSAPTMRIPVGASDATATAAERAQFTVAQGPCFEAHDTGSRVVATETEIARRWPMFYDLMTRTPVRGIVSCPLLDGLAGVGVLDLYVGRSEDVAVVDLAEVDAVAESITSALVAEEMFPNFRNGPLWNGPLWLNNPAVTDRAYVLMAMGMVSVASGLRLEDSLAALRAHAYVIDRTLDATARAVVNRELPADAIADT
jgi:hypothetical protein